MVNKNNKIRLDIQGLRALAVLSVVIFHISPDHITGGYLGVDVFFIISGYLIMGQIWRALSEHRFSFTEFYTKRFKRLLPALVVVLIVSSVAAYFLLLPGEYRSYTYSVFSSLFYFSNFWFYTKSGYFDAELQTAPLLHTWSLSVEEQFYFIFPLLLVFLFKTCTSTRKALMVLVGIALFTLLLSEWLITYDQSLSFYASPTRFWQFIVGGLLAITPTKTMGYYQSQILSFIGIAVLVGLIFTFNEATPFPGLMAVPVTAATALVIYARSERGLMGWVLTNPLSNYFGNISYSFYLWHWPVIIFYKVYLFGPTIEFGKVEKFSLLGVSILLATLTYKLVENPSRRVKVASNTFKPIAVSLAVTICLTAIISSSSFFQEQRFATEVAEFESFLSYKNPFRQDECFLTQTRNDYRLFDKQKCINHKPNKENILLIGDSHAEQWFSAMQSQLEPEQTLSVVTSSGCKPLLPLQGEERCTALIDWGMHTLITDKQFDEIIVAARWKHKDLQFLDTTLSFLKQYTPNVTVFGPVVEYQYPLPKLLAMAGDSPEIMQYANYVKVKQLSNQMAKIILKTGARYYPTVEYMCEVGSPCQFTTQKDIPMQFDYGHLTHEGALEILSQNTVGR
jgi:peptidoglycan/LPS O-acetylase OafA/YrhL